MLRILPEFVKAGCTRLRQRALSVSTWADFASRHGGEEGSVAVVGNAGYLADLRQGERIDAHARVIRLNNFRTIGFEPCVGARCDIFITNFFTDIRFDRRELDGVGHVVASVPNNLRKHRARRLHHRHAEHIVRGLARLGRREVATPSAADFEEACAVCRAVPSTGLMAILFAIRYLRFERLFVTGFSFFRGREHYFNEPGAARTLHDFDRERTVVAGLLRPLIRAGRVDCDPCMLDELARAA